MAKNIVLTDLSNKNEIKLTPEMLNLLCCNKENFLKLIEKMSYKTFVRDKEIYFIYIKSKKYKEKL